MAEVGDDNLGKVLMLSTKHAPKGTDASSFLPWRAEDTEYGWVVWTLGSGQDDTESREGLDDWFKPIAELANKLSCVMIEFDEANFELEGLQTYDW